MADKNVKAELNVEDLEEVAGGVKRDTVEVTLKEGDHRSVLERDMSPWSYEELHSDKIQPSEEELKNQPGRGNIDNPKIKF